MINMLFCTAFCLVNAKCGKRYLNVSRILFTVIFTVFYACFSTVVNFSAILSSSSTVFSMDWMQINSYFPW